jgi:hypothetical protein
MRHDACAVAREAHHRVVSAVNVGEVAASAAIAIGARETSLWIIDGVDRDDAARREDLPRLSGIASRPASVLFR